MQFPAVVGTTVTHADGKRQTRTLRLERDPSLAAHRVTREPLYLYRRCECRRVYLREESGCKCTGSSIDPLKLTAQFNPDRWSVRFVRARPTHSYSGEQYCRRSTRQQTPAKQFAHGPCVRQFAHWFPPYQFFVTRTPISLGSVRNTFVVRPVSSEFRNVPVIAVVLNTFLS